MKKEVPTFYKFEQTVVIMKEKEKEYECIKTFFDSYGMVDSYELLKGGRKDEIISL